MFKDLSNSMRCLAADMVCNAGSGHLGMPLGMADCLTELVKNHMCFSAKNPLWPNRDRLIFSGGHGSALLYSMLYLCGYNSMTLEHIKNFRKLNSLASGHPEYNPNCGIEMSTGPLGEGLASAVGLAIAERILNNRLGKCCIDHFTFVIAGDGDLMEGISHEACSLAGNLGLGRLIVLYDNNSITIDGYTSITCTDNTQKRFESYGWQVIEADGHDQISISSAILEAKSNLEKPSIIFVNTKIGFGSCFEGLPEAHSGILNEEQLKGLKENLGYNYGKFEVPNFILQKWREIGSKYDNIVKSWYFANSGVLEKIDESIKFEFKSVFRDFKKEFFISRPYESTRVIFKNILSKLCEKSKFIVSGSCDLGGSTGCKSHNCIPISKDNFGGNYINYGIREHAMGAIINGICLHGGLIALGGTFLVFSDYMKPAIRLAAMMNIPSIFVFSHDSIGVGEDGPTHQPVEQLAALRSIPNLNVYRPADALETLECVENIINNRRPSVLALTRQKVLSVRFCGRDNLCSKGGYLLYEDSTKHENSITIVATGSEVGIALEIRSILMKHNVSVNIVSMPCFDIFNEQPEYYKNSILGDNPRIIIEAASEFGWYKLLNGNGLFFGVNNFGKSASNIENFNLFKLNSEYIVGEILKKYGY